MIQLYYEAHCRGSSIRLREALLELRESGHTDEQIIDRLIEEVKHINRDGAEYLVEELIGLRYL